MWYFTLSELFNVLNLIPKENFLDKHEQHVFPLVNLTTITFLH